MEREPRERSAHAENREEGYTWRVRRDAVEGEREGPPGVVLLEEKRKGSGEREFEGRARGLRTREEGRIQFAS